MATLSSAGGPSAIMVPSPHTWWIKDPLDSTVNTPVRTNDQLNVVAPIQSGKFYPLGEDYAIVLTGDEVRGEEFQLAFWALSKDAHDRLLVLLKSKRVLLLQDVIEQQWYVKCVDSVQRARIRTENEANGLTGHTHTINATFVQVERP